MRTCPFISVCAICRHPRLLLRGPMWVVWWSPNIRQYKLRWNMQRRHKASFVCDFVTLLISFGCDFVPHGHHKLSRLVISKASLSLSLSCKYNRSIAHDYLPGIWSWGLHTIWIRNGRLHSRSLLCNSIWHKLKWKGTKMTKMICAHRPIVNPYPLLTAINK